ncbi:MAG: transglutaminase family protein [Cyanobacteriota bacterium]|nr:transglutaminase family protein [Cyanobacteriota bacterium]
MKTFDLRCQLGYTLQQQTPAVFNIQPVENNVQKIVGEDLYIKPSLSPEEYRGLFEQNRYLRVNPPEGDFEISYSATVEVSYFWGDPNSIRETPPAELPADTLHYLYPSRYCQSDLLFGLAMSEFGELVPDYSRVTAICNWIYDKVQYVSGSSDSQTSAYDTATQRTGVCRDFAHLAIAFCRALNIPARFVSAYAYKLQPPDFHACFEAYLGDRWYLFDATRLVPLDGIIRISTGRDAADVSFATFFGAAQLDRMNLSVDLVSESEENDFGGEGAIAIN